MRGLTLLIFVLCILLLPGTAQPARAQSMLSEGYAAADARYSPSERAGREIWFFATAFNDRFFTYAYPQRLGAAIDWYKANETWWRRVISGEYQEYYELQYKQR